MPQRRMMPPKGYITATQAKKRLGNISDGMLRTYITKGEIERLVPDTRSQGFYRAEDVQKLAARLKLPDRTVRFLAGTIDDLAECYDLLAKIFGGNNPVDAAGRPIAANPMERRASWVTKNPETFYLLRAGREMVGCIFMLPLTREKVAQILESETTPPIHAEDVQEYAPGVPVHLYVMSACVYASDRNILTKRFYGSRLIAGILSTFVDFGKRGIILQSIVGRSESRDGIGLMKHAGFTEIESSTHHRNFRIDVRESGIPEILTYKRALRASGYEISSETLPERQQPPSLISPIAHTPQRVQAVVAPRVPRQGAISQGNIPAGSIALKDFLHGMSVSTAKRNIEMEIGDWRGPDGHVINRVLTAEQQHKFYRWAHNRPGFVTCPECPHDL